MAENIAGLKSALEKERAARREAERAARKEATRTDRPSFRELDELRGRCLRLSESLTRAHQKITHLERELENHTKETAR